VLKRPKSILVLGVTAGLAGSLLFVSGVSGATHAYAACTATEPGGGGCGSTPTPDPSDTNVKPSSSAAQPSSGPTVTAAPDPTTATVSGPPTIRGTFTLGSGAPWVGVPVTLTAVDSIPDDGTAAAPTVVGTATTAADGSWAYTLPATLPSGLQALADANGGVLAVEADVTGTAPDGTVMTGSDFVDAGVASGTDTTDGSVSARQEAPDTIQIHPATSTSAITPASTPDGDPAAQDSSPVPAQDAVVPEWQAVDGSSTDGYNPDVVGGVNYANVTPSIVPCAIKDRVLATSVQYTTVGEGHAYYDATAAFEYNDTLSSTWGIATSIDGKYWSIKGKVSRKTSMGRATGFVGKGPYWAQQFRVPIQYQERDHEYLCTNNRVLHNYSIVPIKYMVPAGKPVSAFGSDVRSHDGYNAYSRSKSSYRAVLSRGTYYTITSGTSITYGLAAKVFSVEISLDTDFSKTHFQKITAGTGPQEHDIWGSKGPVWSNPGVLYSY
jgi:hypothetical protein